MGHFGSAVQHLGVARGWGFFEVEPQLPLYGMSFCFRSSSHSQYPLSVFFLLSSSLSNHLSPRGSGPLYFWEKKKMLFVTFFQLLFSLLSCCAEMHDGKMGGQHFFLPQFCSFIILWTNSSRGLGKKGKGWRAKKDRNRAPTVICFDFLRSLQTHTCWRHSSGCCTHSDGLDFSQDDKQLEGPNDWMCLAVIGSPLSSQIKELKWSGLDVFRWRF